MRFRSIRQHISMVAVFGLLPLALAAAEVREPFEAEQEGTQLIGQTEDVARDIYQSADQLSTFTRVGQVFESTHKNQLMQIKSLVNDRLNPTLNRLAEIQLDLPEWQQGTIDQMLESARSLAVNTNSAILNMNENPGLPVLLNAEYGNFVSRINDHAEALVKTADAAGNYGDALQKAIDAGLSVPKH